MRLHGPPKPLDERRKPPPHLLGEPGARPEAVCLSCFGTCFVRLRNGRRAVCFGCEQPEDDEIEGRDSAVRGSFV